MSFLGNTPTTQSFTSLTERFNGNGSATTVTLSRAVYNASDIEVLVNNVQQDPYEAYTVNGTQTLTFTEAPSSGTGNIIVTYRNYTISKFVPGEGTVTAAAIIDGTITGAKITSNTINGSQIVDRSITGLEIAANTIGSSNLVTTGVSSGTYGGATQIPVVTVGTDGRLSYAANVAFIGSQWTTAASDISYNAGSVGIGTTSFSGIGEKLNTTGFGILTQSALGTNRALFGTFGGSTQIVGSFDSIPLEVRTNNAARFLIGTSGQLGIGGATYGSSGQVLTSGGSGAAPSWATPAGGSLRFISAVTATAASEVEFLSGINSTYDTYVFEITNVYRTADATTELRMQLYSAGAYVAGTSYLTHITVSDLGAAGYGTALTYSNQSTGRLTNTASIPYTAGNANAYNAVATLTGVNSGRANFRTFALSNGDNTKIDSSTNIYAQTITGIKFFLAAGTINCTIRMYGISKT